MQRFLIIGASGYVGGHIRRYIARQDANEVVGTCLRSVQQSLIRYDLARDRIGECVPAAWRERTGDKWAILCSAVVPIDRCATESKYARKVMVDGTKRCLDELVQLGFVPVFLSSSYVFDGNKGGYGEEDPANPASHYGQLKLEIEIFLQQNHPNALIARLDKVVGADPLETHLFSEWHTRVSKKEPILCIQDQVFGPTLVNDVAHLLFQACRHKLQGCYHLANPEPTARSQLAALFLDSCGLEAEVRNVPLSAFNLPEPRLLRSWLKADKILGALGGRFTTVDSMLQQYQDNLRA